jgi:hypothetical protein
MYDVQPPCAYHESITNRLLPEDFRVYVRPGCVINHGCPGMEEKILPTVNHYTGKEGGYLAIYTTDASKGIYDVGNGIYVAGQVRFPGHYVGRIFVHEGHEFGKAATEEQLQELLAICAQYFPELGGNMWLGGDTGGWFGVQ